MFGMKTMKMRRRTEVAGMRMILNLLLGYCAVVLGSPLRGTVARRIVLGAMPLFVSAVSVFVWLFLRSRISCPLLFYAFALCKPNAALRRIDFFRRD